MKDLKKIEKAAEKYAESISLGTEDTEIDDEFHAEDFVKGAISPEAKEYWQEGMYTEEEVQELLHNCLIYCNAFSTTERIRSFLKAWFEQNKKKNHV